MRNVNNPITNRTRDASIQLRHRVPPKQPLGQPVYSHCMHWKLEMPWNYAIHTWLCLQDLFKSCKKKSPARKATAFAHRHKRNSSFPVIHRTDMDHLRTLFQREHSSFIVGGHRMTASGQFARTGEIYTLSRYNPGSHWEKLSQIANTSVKTVPCAGQIWTGHITQTRQKCFRFSRRTRSQFSAHFAHWTQQWHNPKIANWLLLLLLLLWAG